MKGFIKNNGKIRNCDNNIAKMNVLEYIIYIDLKSYLSLDTLSDLLKQYESVFYAIVNTLLLIFFPITLLIRAIVRTRMARKDQSTRIWTFFAIAYFGAIISFNHRVTVIYLVYQ